MVIHEKEQRPIERRHNPSCVFDEVEESDKNEGKDDTRNHSQYQMTQHDLRRRLRGVGVFDLMAEAFKRFHTEDIPKSAPAGLLANHPRKFDSFCR